MTKAERRTAIIRAYLETSQTCREIGLRFGVSDAAVVQCVKRAGKPLRNQRISEARKRFLANGPLPKKRKVGHPPHGPSPYDGGPPKVGEHPDLHLKLADPKYIEVAPRQFVEAETFDRYKNLVRWREFLR